MTCIYGIIFKILHSVSTKCIITNLDIQQKYVQILVVANLPALQTLQVR